MIIAVVNLLKGLIIVYEKKEWIFVLSFFYKLSQTGKKVHVFVYMYI